MFGNQVCNGRLTRTKAVAASSEHTVEDTAVKLHPDDGSGHQMVVAWLFLTSFLFDTQETENSAAYSEIAALCKYHVIYFEIGTNISYFENWLERNPPNKQEWEYKQSNESFRTRLSNDARERFERLSTGGLDQVNLYTVEKPNRRFFDMEVYVVYPPSENAIPYKMGIFRYRSEMYVLFVRFSGFTERIHFKDDVAPYKSYNDELDITVVEYDSDSKFALVWAYDALSTALDDFSTGNPAEFDEFVKDWIQLTRYSGRPGDFKLLSNEFDLIDGALVGNCRTAELDRSSNQDSSVAVKEWSYKISGFQLFNREKPSLKLVSQTTSEDTSGILSP